MSRRPGTTSAPRRLCAAVVHNMVKEAQGDREPRLRPHAVAWLASSRARLFFEPLGFSQSSWLARSEWRSWAQETLAHATPEETRVIEAGLDYLDGLPGAPGPSEAEITG